MYPQIIKLFELKDFTDMIAQNTEGGKENENNNRE